jgi:hypothetical protein
MGKMSKTTIIWTDEQIELFNHLDEARANICNINVSMYLSLFFLTRNSLFLTTRF